MTAPDFGLETMYRLHSITNRRDAMILLVHFVLTKKGFKCAGQGTTWEESVCLSEVLPNGWTESREGFRYQRQSDSKERITVKYEEEEDYLQVNIRTTSNLHTLNLRMSTVIETNLSQTDPRQVYVDVCQRIQEIESSLESLGGTSVRSVGSSTSHVGPLRDESPSCPDPYEIHRRENRHSSNPLYSDPVPLGRRDLDPFAGTGPGGGMICDPLRIGPSRNSGIIGPDGVPLPRGAVPPGARFDPFGPGGNPMFPGNPDNDLFMPPGMPPGRGRGQFGSFDPGNSFM